MIQRASVTSQSRCIILLMGPTAVGKSALGFTLAQKIGGAIVSADSMQIYRALPIGTAQPPAWQQAAVPHYLVGCYPLTQLYSAAHFVTDAQQAIAAVHAQGQIPILVGGSGFYIQGLLRGVPTTPPRDRARSEALEAQADALGVDALYAQLCQYDPDYAQRISRRDRHKVVRALEIVMTTGKPMAHFLPTAPRLPWRCFPFILYRDRHKSLNRLIEARCDQMLQEGLIQETAHVAQQLYKNSSACRAVGYRQVLAHLATGGGLRAAFHAASRQLAKRQMTWFSRYGEGTWIDLDCRSIETVCSSIVQQVASEGFL